MDSRISRITLHDLAAMATLFSGLTLALLIGFAKRVDQSANLFLSLALVLHSTNTLGDKNISSFKLALTKIASVKNASISEYLPIDGTNRNQNTFFKEGRERLDPAVGAQIWQVDDTYLQTLGIQLVEGRNFSYDMAGDTAGGSVIINQDMVKKLGLKNPLGARISNGAPLQ